MDLIIGVVVGAAFAPFWMMLYTKFVKPQVLKLLGK